MLSKIFFVTLITTLLLGINLYAHCDGLDGPVVKAAVDALENKDVKLVLIWVQEKDEAEVIDAFEKTLRIRELSPEVKELADKYFFETVVRLHRSGEGEDYTGLKPAGRDLGPVIPLADLAIEHGNIDELSHLLLDSIEKRIKENFHRVIHSKNFDKNKPAEGREYVEAYVIFLHHAEKLYELNQHFELHTQSSEENHKH